MWLLLVESVVAIAVVVVESVVAKVVVEPVIAIVVARVAIAVVSEESLSFGLSLSFPLAIESIVVVVVESVVAVVVLESVETIAIVGVDGRAVVAIAIGSIGVPHGEVIAIVVIAMVSEVGLAVSLRLGSSEGSAEGLKYL